MSDEPVVKDARYYRAKFKVDLATQATWAAELNDDINVAFRQWENGIGWAEPIQKDLERYGLAFAVLNRARIFVLRDLGFVTEPGTRALVAGFNISVPMP